MNRNFLIIDLVHLKRSQHCILSWDGCSSKPKAKIVSVSSLGLHMIATVPYYPRSNWLGLHSRLPQSMQIYPGLWHLVGKRKELTLATIYQPWVILDGSAKKVSQHFPLNESCALLIHWQYANPRKLCPGVIQFLQIMCFKCYATGTTLQSLESHTH